MKNIKNSETRSIEIDASPLPFQKILISLSPPSLALTTKHFGFLFMLWNFRE